MSYHIHLIILNNIDASIHRIKETTKKIVRSQNAAQFCYMLQSQITQGNNISKSVLNDPVQGQRLINVKKAVVIAAQVPLI